MIGAISSTRESLTARDFAVTFEEIAEPANVAGPWRELETRGQASFFQSWVWIGNWLATLPDSVRPWLIAVRHQGQIVGLCILVKCRRWRHGIFPANGIFLNETGDPGLDGLTIEFNGILADRRVKESVWRACLDFLVEQVPGWDAFYMSGIGIDEYRQLSASERGLLVDITDRKPSPYADLRLIRESNGGLLSTLSRNTRHQVRRAMRGYELRGTLELRAAGTVQEAQAFFSDLKILHQAYWTGRSMPGAFASEYFEIFHRHLISENFGNESVELLRISAGEKIIGYLYNFQIGGWFYNYQSGFNYEAESKLKPGLVSHCLAMLRYLDRDAIAYDFLAGDSQYKRSLSNAQRQLVWLVVRRDLLKHHIEDACKRIYHAGKRKRADGD